MIEVVRADALTWMLTQDPRRWGLLLIDPPYGQAHKSGSIPRVKFKGVEIVGDQNTAARDAALEWWGDRPAAVFGSWRIPVWGKPAGMLVWDKGGQSGGGDVDFPWWQGLEVIHLYGSWNRDGAGRMSPILDIAPPYYSDGAKHHPHQKPVPLLQQILDAAPPGPVLDMFGGSGSTAVAADGCGRDVTVVECDKQWWPVIDRRIAAETRQRPLFA
jgi:site-specific DNA-methyltransferase (adenine-specific)